jgi:hypothetical protein
MSFKIVKGPPIDCPKLLLIPCHPLPVKYVWPYVIESRLNDLYYIVNTPTRRKKTQICQVTRQGFSKKMYVNSGC